MSTNKLEINPHLTRIPGHGPITGSGGFRRTVLIWVNRLDTETYSSNGSVETGPGAGLISRTLPLGPALLDSKIGNEVQVKAAGGFSKFKVVAV